MAYNGPTKHYAADDSVRAGGKYASRNYETDVVTLAGRTGGEHDPKHFTDEQLLTKIDQIYGGLTRLDAATATDLHQVFLNINEGNFGAIRGAARSAFIDMADVEADEASDSGVDTSDLETLNPVALFAHERADEHNLWLSSIDATAEQYAAASIAADTSTAYVHSSYILDHRFPDFTQEAFDHLTRPYREVVDTLGDEAAPASWAKRPLEQDIIDAMQPDLRAKVTVVEAAAEHARIHQTVMTALDQNAV